MHLIFSVCGGTGCGTFLDTAFLIREILGRASRARVLGYCVYPDGIVAPLSRDERWASVGAAMRDLEYFMQLGSGSFQGWGDAPRRGEKLRYSKNAYGYIAPPFTSVTSLAA